MRFLILSDIHGNYPALAAVWNHFEGTAFTAIFNCGDSLVYAPYSNETIDWLREHKAISILGNTDRKIVRLLKGKNFKKPSKEEKRIMYSRSAAILTETNANYLIQLKKKRYPKIKGLQTSIALFHGSPENPEEFLFDTTPASRFKELAKTARKKDIDIVITGHSHTPYHKKIEGIHFLNPGSVGRMFDGNPQASCAVLNITGKKIEVKHFRVTYPVKEVIQTLRNKGFPEIYCAMYKTGRKLN